MSATQRDAIRYFCQQKGMTEEELAKKINEAFEKPTGEELIHVLNKGAAIGRREMLDKVCQYLFENYHGGKLSLRMIEDLRKAMEE